MSHQERKDKTEAVGVVPPPKGWMGVRVGQDGEEQRRFLVPVTYLNHPLFAELLDEAAEEYGFSQRGAIAIPCAVDHFCHVQDIIDRETAGGGGTGFLHCHPHHHHHHHHRHHHYHLPHFTGCFGAS